MTESGWWSWRELCHRWHVPKPSLTTVVVFGTLICVRVLIVVTYPLNLLIADGRNYLRMLIAGTSDLIHAPGYSFFTGLLWRNPLGWWLNESHPLVFDRLLPAFQHAINLGCLYLGFRAVREIFGTAPAVLFACGYGLSFQVLTATSSSSPEWLQGSLVMVIGFLLLRSWKVVGLARKIALYSGIGFLSFVIFVVKFNSIALLTLPALVVAADFIRERRSILAPVVGALVLLVSYGVFVLAFHYPSTGTVTITMDKAWILLERLAFFVPDRTLSPETGISTARLLALNSVLPWPEHQGPVSHIDSIPEKRRKKYTQRYGYLLSAEADELDSVLASAKIPKPYPFSKAYLPIAHSLGLRESNDLGKKVFVENVLVYRHRFLESVWDLTMRTLTKKKRYWLYPLDVKEGEYSKLGYGFIRLNDAVGDGRPDAYRYRDPVMWLPGIRFAEFHHRISQFPPLWVPFTIAIGLIFWMRRLWRSRRIDICVFTALASTLTVVLYTVFSNCIYHFRWKEVHPILPLVCVVIAVIIVEVAGYAVQLEKSVDDNAE